MTAMGDLIRAASYSFARVLQRALDLELRESDPRKTDEMLPDWERAFGLSEGSLTKAQRRNNLVSLLRGIGSPTQDTVQSLVEAHGYPEATITKMPLFVCGEESGAQSACPGEAWVHTGIVVVPPTIEEAELQIDLDAVAHIHGNILIQNWIELAPTPTLVTDEDLYDVATDGNETWIAVGAGGTILLSTDDGLTWAVQTPDSSYTGTFRCVAFGASTWVIAGDSGEVQTSADGITWATQAFASISGSGSARQMLYDGSLFVVVANDGADGQIETSVDGVTWVGQHTEAGDPLNGIAFGGSIYIACGENGKILSATDPTDTWTSRTADDSYTGTFNKVAHNGSVFCLVGASSEIQTSATVSDWESQTNLSAAAINAVAAGTDGTLCAVDADRKSQKSVDDGITWADNSPILDPSDPPEALNGITSSSTHWLCVGTGAKIYRTGN